ncbi:MAG: BamA/TamA family outer membrane protein, partial [Mucilaginibacter sp.]
MKKLIALYLFLIPAVVFAQDASNTIPQQTAIKDTSRQRDLIDIAKRLFKIDTQNPRIPRDKKVYFSFLPVPGAEPGGTGRSLITSTTAGIYLGPKSTTNISSANFAPYWNLNERFGLPLRSSIWLKDNTWYIQGDMRLLVYPQYTWGLGDSHDYNDKTLAGDNYIRFYQSALKRITPYFFAGGGYNLDYHSNIKSEDAGIDLQQFTGYAYGTSGRSFSSGVNLSLLYDTRNNSINPLPGSYINIVYRVNPAFMGSSNTWNSLYVDVRKYVPLNPANKNQQNTLAFWSYLWTVFESNAPYLDLPSIGWDPYNRSGEGLDQSRYRGKSLFYA